MLQQELRRLDAKHGLQRGQAENIYCLECLLLPARAIPDKIQEVPKRGRWQDKNAAVVRTAQVPFTQLDFQRIHWLQKLHGR